MTQRKIVSLLLAVIMLLGLSAPAFAEGEPGVPPPAEATAEAPPAVETPPASNEIVSAEDTVTEDTTVECVTTEEPAFENENADDGIMTVSVAPVSVGGVTVNLIGALEGLDEVIFENTDNDEFYHATSSGIWWDELPEIVTTLDKAVIHHVVQAASSLPTQFVVRPGGEVRFWTQGEYGITVDNGTIVSDETNSWYGGGDAARNLRCITVTTPSSGTMNVNVYADGAEVAQVVPYTFNNEDWENGIVVGGGTCPRL